MTASLQHYLVITALGADRPGIVNTITRHVSSCGCNIEDSRLAMLGDEFTFIMLLSGSWNAELVSRTQPGDGDSAQLFIQITAHSPATQNAANIEQAFKALCTELNAQGSINIVNYSQHDEQDGV